MTDIENRATLAELGEALIRQMRNLNYADASILIYRRNIRYLADFMEANSLGYYSGEVGALYLASLKGCVNRRYLCGIRTFISRLDDCLMGRDYRRRHNRKELPQTPEGYKHVEKMYLEHCRAAGNSDATLKEKAFACTQFFTSLSLLGASSIDGVSPSHLSQAVLSQQRRYIWGDYRDLLRFMSAQGFLDKDYSFLVPKNRRQPKCPDTYSKDERVRLEHGVDQSSPRGKRDYAIILLADRLGLRSSDIAGMELSSLDMENDMIRFCQAKTGRWHALCMLPDIKAALSDYINNGRPCSGSPLVFLQHNAPFSGISGPMVHTIITKWLRKAGIDIGGRRHGAHSLRSSLATDMVNNGETYEQVRGVLGHSSPDAIMHYARLDIERLRLCSLEARPPSGYFLRFLNGEEARP